MDINLEGSEWKSAQDFTGFSSPPSDHRNGTAPFPTLSLFDALSDLNAGEPPYKIRILKARHVSSDLINHIMLAKPNIARARAYVRKWEDHDVGVDVDIIDDPVALQTGAIVLTGKDKHVVCLMQRPDDRREPLIKSS